MASDDGHQSIKRPKCYKIVSFSILRGKFAQNLRSIPDFYQGVKVIFLIEGNYT